MAKPTGTSYNIGFSPKPMFVQDQIDEDKNRAVVQVRSVTWPKLIEIAKKTHVLENKHKAPYLIFGKFTPDEHARPRVNSEGVKYAFRVNASVEQVEGLTLDLDDCPFTFASLQKRLAKRNLNYILFTTYSYNPDDPDKDSRFRIIVPLDKPIPVENLRAAGLGLAKALGIPPKEIDLASLVISQPSYLHACPPAMVKRGLFNASQGGRPAPAARLIEIGLPYLEELGSNLSDDDRRSGAKLIRDLKAGKVGIGDRHAAFGKFIADCKNKGWTFEETFEAVDTMNAKLGEPLPDDQIDGLSRFWSTFDRNDNAFSYVELAERVDALLEYTTDTEKLDRKIGELLRSIGNSVAERKIYGNKSRNGLTGEQLTHLVEQLAVVTQVSGKKTYWKSEIFRQSERRVSEHRRKQEQKREAEQLADDVSDDEELDFELVNSAKAVKLFMHETIPYEQRLNFPNVHESDGEGEEGDTKISLPFTYDNFNHLLDLYDIGLCVDVFKKTGTAYIHGEQDPNPRSIGVQLRSIINNNKLRGWKDQLDDFILYNALQNSHNPIEAWLDSLRYYGEGYIDELASCLVVAPEHKRIRDLMIRRWMIQACAAANMNMDNDKSVTRARPIYGYMVVLQGAQGTNKSKFFRSLLPEHIAEDYLKAGAHYDYKDKDSLAQVVSGWLVELEELDTTFSKTETGAMKQFLTRATDTWRAPYGRYNDEWKRCSSYWGSVNEQGFLRDDTGNRRFWPIQVHRITMPDEPGCDADIESAWAEAWYAYLWGEQWWPTVEEEKLFEEYRLDNFSSSTVSPIAEAMFELFGDAEQMLKDKKEFGTYSLRISQIMELVYTRGARADRNSNKLLNGWLEKNCLKYVRDGKREWLLVPDFVKGGGRSRKWHLPRTPDVKAKIEEIATFFDDDEDLL